MQHFIFANKEKGVGGDEIPSSAKGSCTNGKCGVFQRGTSKHQREKKGRAESEREIV